MPYRSFVLVLVCFLLSGFAALLYETAWTRELALVFGTAELAVATVLAAYMGGLALGAAIAGRVALRVTRPLLVYGLLELGIALAALGVPIAIRASSALSIVLFGRQSAPPEGDGFLLALFFLASSFAIVLVPTGLMGATLPLLARFAVRSEQEIGSRVGILYAMNTVGAVFGTLVAGFVLLPELGLRRTVLVGVGTNALVFAGAALLARRSEPPVAAETTRQRVQPTGRRWLVLPLVLASGAASFAYEVLWTRLLAHVLGGSVYAFATMLASFLTGIALGGAVAAWLATTPSRAARGFAAAQVGIGLLSWSAFVAVDWLPSLALQIGAGSGGGLARNAAVAALVLLPATFCVGMTFPLAVRVLAAGGADAAAASARVYAWNTVGAMIGSVGAGFVLIPLLGYAGMLGAAVAVNLVLGVAAALGLGAPWPRAALAAGAALACLALRPPATPWRLVGAVALDLRRTPPPPVFFAIGRSATVALTPERRGWRLRTNGLPEGLILATGHPWKSALERWLGALPSIARPDTRSLLMIGFGAGSAVEALPATVESIDVIEIEPLVVDASRLVAGRRAVDPLADPRLRVWTNDARASLTLTTKRWDAIVSQPSHPWTAAASHLYTREFFALAADHLTPGGVFVQWMELDYVDEPLLRTLLATLLDVFPHVRLYRPVPRGGALFLCSGKPLPLEQAERAIAASPSSYQWAGVQTAEDVAASLALDEDGVRHLATGAPLNTDDRNLLQSGSPRVLNHPLGRQGADRLLAPFDPLLRLDAQLDRLYLIRRVIGDGDVHRAARIATGLAQPIERLVGSALVDLALRDRARAAERLRRAFALDPGSREAHAALARLDLARILAGDPQTRGLVESLSDPGAAVVEGWRSAARGDWAAVRALEERLAEGGPRDPFFPDAARLRAQWRIARGDAASRGAEAVALLDGVLRLGASRDDLQLRERAARLANQHTTR